MEEDILQGPNKADAKNLSSSVNQEEDDDLVDNVEHNGTIAKARIHYSAQSVLKIPEHYDAGSNRYF
jgi:hypothetical protein